MLFVPFTRLNHHYHSIFFGFALLKDDTEDTFVWVLETWLEVMNNKAPVTIITDQDKSISNAIVRSFLIHTMHFARGRSVTNFLRNYMLYMLITQHSKMTLTSVCINH